MLFLEAVSTPYVDGQDLIVWSMTIRVLADTPPWRETNDPAFVLLTVLMLLPVSHTNSH